MQIATIHLPISLTTVLPAATGVPGLAIGLALTGILIGCLIFFVMLWDLRQTLRREARLNKPYRRMLLESLTADTSPPLQTPTELALAMLADRCHDRDPTLNGHAHESQPEPASLQERPLDHLELESSSELGKIADRYIASKEVLLEQEPAPDWDHGCATHQGRVRTENQDAVASVRVGDCVLLVGCDGCGGMPEGRAAARLAVDAATDSIASRLEPGQPPESSEKLAELCLAGINAAQQRLRLVAAAHGLDPTGAMRCTMIVVLADSNSFYFAYLGDGGVYLHRDGETHSLMAAHRAEKFSNIITSSMGPLIHGEPGRGSSDRLPGDLLWLCSDGVADRAEPGPLSKMLADHIIQTDGDLGDAIGQVLSALADCRDPEDDLVIFDDNMLIAAVTDRQLTADPLTTQGVN